MIINLWRKRYKLKFLSLLIVNVGLLIIYSNFENLTAEVRSFLVYNTPIKAIPAPLWTQVKNVFLKKSSWRTNGNLTDSVISGCTLPQLDPWDPNILRYVSARPEPQCHSSQPQRLLYTRDNVLLVNLTSLAAAGYSDITELACSFRYIRLLDSENFELGPANIISQQRTVLSNDYTGILSRCVRRSLAWLDSDWVPAIMLKTIPSVIMETIGIIVYRNINVYVPRIQKAVEAKENAHYNVAILIIDALSQQNLIRSLPNTLSYLDSKGGLLFTGFNKVGHNSYPNVMAMVSGETGGPYPPPAPEGGGIYLLDKERQAIIQTVYKRHGYTSLHMEDLEIYGTFARDKEIGLSQPPTDLYYRGPYMAMWKLHLLNSLLGKWDCYACVQDEFLHVQEFQVIGDFLNTYSDVPNMMFVHLAQYSHNDVNMAKFYDNDLQSMIQSLYEKGALKRTYLMILGDHGFQRGEDPFLMTDQGKKENNLPGFYLLPPEKLVKEKSEMHANLVKNAQRLTSFWDVNQMLRQILSMSLDVNTTSLFPNYEGHGTSLLSDVGDRTCQEAEIPEAYCECQDGVKGITGKQASDLATAMVLDINNFLASFTFCNHLDLDEVEGGSVKILGKIVSVRVQFDVKGGGKFEGRFSYNLAGEEMMEGKAVRLDLYEPTSRCVPRSLAHIKPFCIC